MTNSFNLEGRRPNKANGAPPPAKTAAEAPSAWLELLDGPGIAVDDPELEYIIAALGMTAGSGAPHMFAGYGFSGKTMLAQALALAVAAGRMAWGGMSCRAGRVVHVDLEQGKRLTKRRYKRLAYGMGIDLAELGDRIALAARPDLKLVADHRERWLALMKGRSLIIIDSWRAACPGIDENSSAVRESLDMLGALSEETGCRAIVIHHARKPNEHDAGGSKFSIRGSSGFYDGCDAIYVFAAQKGEPIKIACEKAREHGEPVDEIAVEIHDVAGEFGPKSGLAIKLYGVERIAHLRAERVAAANDAAMRAVLPKVVEAVTKAHSLGASLASIDAIRSAVHAGKPAVQAAVQEAIESGHIYRAKAGRSTEFRPGRAPADDGGPEDRPRTDGGPGPAQLTEDQDRQPRRSGPSSDVDGEGDGVTEDRSEVPS